MYTGSTARPGDRGEIDVRAHRQRAAAARQAATSARSRSSSRSCVASRRGQLRVGSVLHVVICAAPCLRPSSTSAATLVGTQPPRHDLVEPLGDQLRRRGSPPRSSGAWRAPPLPGSGRAGGAGGGASSVPLAASHAWWRSSASISSSTPSPLAATVRRTGGSQAGRVRRGRGPSAGRAASPAPAAPAPAPDRDAPARSGTRCPAGSPA